MLALRPLTAISTVDAAFRLYRRHFSVLFAISLIINVPVTAASVGMNFMMSHIEHIIASNQGEAELLRVALLFVAYLGAVMVVMFISSIFGSAASTEAAGRAATLQPVELQGSLAAAMRCFWPLFAASLLTTAALFFALFLFVVPAVILLLGFWFVGPVIVLEKVGALPAIERSWALTQGRLLKIMGVVLILAVVTVTPSGLLGVLQLVPELRSNLFWQLVITLAGSAVSVLFTPVWYVSTVLLYYDARVEHEAFDVEVLARLVGREGQPA